MEWLKNNWMFLVTLAESIGAYVWLIIHYVTKHSKTKEEKRLEKKERETKKDLARVERLQKSIDALKAKHAGGK